MSRLELRDVTKRFGKETALDGVSLHAEPGEILAVVGPSGAGKSTLLKVAAGVEAPTDGTVSTGGEDVTRIRSWQRQAAMVFESYVLYPHLSVGENISFPLRSPAVRDRYSDAEVEERVRRVAAICEIDHLLERRPVALSGGQRQRVALSRALVRDASVYLMDEPIAHLDAKLRHWLRGELRRLLGGRDVPTIWATPDGIEAMAISDRIAVLVGGRIVQVGPPRELYSRPRTIDVARLLGDPVINILSASVDDDGIVRLDGAADRPLLLECSDGPVTSGPVRIGLRPAGIRLVGRDEPAAIPGAVIGTEYGSRDSVVIARVGEDLVRVVVRQKDLPKVGETVWLGVAGTAVHGFAADGTTQFAGQLVGAAVRVTQQDGR